MLPPDERGVLYPRDRSFAKTTYEKKVRVHFDPNSKEHLLLAERIEPHYTR
jgi:hypothetical protein